MWEKLLLASRWEPVTSVGPGPLWTRGLWATLRLYVITSPPAMSAPVQASFPETPEADRVAEKGGGPQKQG